jgi:hypothetical protein
MPAERLTAPESQLLTHVRDAAREGVHTLTGAATKLLDLVLTQPEAEKAPQRAYPYGRRAPHREPLLPLEAWLGAGCVVMVLWAVGWL